MKQNFDENTLRRYLLGTVSETEQITVEDAVFSDAELRSMLQTEENDLIDEYVRGELDGTERGQFEQMFFNSEERRQKIEFAETFNQLSAAAESQSPANVPGDEGKSFWHSLLVFLQTPQIAFTAILLIVLGFGAFFLFTRNAQNPPIARQENVNQNFNAKITQTPADITPTRTPVADNINTNPNIVKPDINKGNENKNAGTPSLTPLKKTPDTAPTFATLVFPAGLVRDGGNANQKFSLTLPKNASQARLVFNIEKGDERPFYTIDIKTKSGSAVTRAKVARRKLQLNLLLPAANLPAGIYTATVRGIAADGSSEALGYYDFEIIKP